MKVMKALGILLSVLVASLAMQRSGNAQIIAVGSSSSGGSVDYSTPTVPLEVGLKGRKAVADYLSMGIDSTGVTYGGRSVMNTPAVYLNRSDLQQRGYVHNGQFSELTNALASMAFSGQVVPTPDGRYDVECTLTCYSIDGKKLLTGFGSLAINENADGSLSTSTFQPYLIINSSVIYTVTNVNTAKWLGLDYQERDLMVVYDAWGRGYGIVIPLDLLDKGGSIIMADSTGNVSGRRIGSGQRIQGKALYAMLGQISTSDYQPLVNPTSLGAFGRMFYVNNGKVFGRYPLLDIVATNSLTVGYGFSVPIWGTTQVATPSHIFVKAIYLNDPHAGSVDGQEFEIPQGFNATLPAGGYHVRVEFGGVWDWDADEFTKGAIATPIVEGEASAAIPSVP